MGLNYLAAGVERPLGQGDEEPGQHVGGEAAGEGGAEGAEVGRGGGGAVVFGRGLVGGRE